MSIANNHGFSVLRDNPEAMGTSLDMLRRAATTLVNLSKHPDNRSLFVQQESRLLQLVMSQILEQKVAALVAQVLYQCSIPEGSAGCKNFYSNSNNETFYAPSLSRNRVAGSGPTMQNPMEGKIHHHHHHPHHNMMGPATGILPPLPQGVGSPSGVGHHNHHGHHGREPMMVNSVGGVPNSVGHSGSHPNNGVMGGSSNNSSSSSSSSLQGSSSNSFGDSPQPTCSSATTRLSSGRENSSSGGRDHVGPPGGNFPFFNNQMKHHSTSTFVPS